MITLELTEEQAAALGAAIQPLEGTAYLTRELRDLALNLQGLPGRQYADYARHKSEVEARIGAAESEQPVRLMEELKIQQRRCEPSTMAWWYFEGRIVEAQQRLGA